MTLNPRISSQESPSVDFVAGHRVWVPGISLQLVPMFDSGGLQVGNIEPSARVVGACPKKPGLSGHQCPPTLTSNNSTWLPLCSDFEGHTNGMRRRRKSKGATRRHDPAFATLSLSSPVFHFSHSMLRSPVFVHGLVLAMRMI